MVMTGKRVPNPDVEAWFQKKQHPLEDALRRCRKIILDADERIEESIKWQTPTFSYNGNIVSFAGNAKKLVSLMFHRGAEIPGEHPLLEGDGKLVRNIRFADLQAVEAGSRELTAVIQAWCTAKET